MEEYKSNSHKSKEVAKQHAIEKVVSGKVRVKRQRKGNLEKAAEIFTGQDLNSVKEHLIKNVLFPNIQKLLYDTITNGADTIIYGGKGKNKRSDGTRVPYWRSYDSESGSNNEKPTYSGRGIYNFENLLFEKKQDAEAVLDSMQEIIDQFGVVSVADLYDLADVTIDNTTASNYGWKSIASAKSVATPDGWILSLSKPIYLN